MKSNTYCFLSKRLSSVLLLVLVLPAMATGQTKEDGIITSAMAVLDETMSIPAKQIPGSLLKEARGVAIVPGVVKGGLVVGVRHGRGVMLVRSDADQWLPPRFITLTGGSVGWQAGIQSTDVVLVFRTRKSVNDLMNGRLTIGADAAAAAGPIGRQASAATDARLSAEILSYSRSRGLFAGVSLDGSVIQVDHLAGMAYYRQPSAVSPTSSIPQSALNLMNRLASYSGAPQTPSPSAVVTQPAAIPSKPHVSSPHAEQVRRQLIDSWNRFSVLLDDKWKAYLTLPTDVISGTSPINRAGLNMTLERYTSISTKPEYSALNQRHEFAATYQLLREYATLQAQQPGTTITLPPPPPRSATNPNARGRY